MKKILLGLVAATTVAAPIALTAGSASADTTTSADPECVPVFEKAAVAEVNHVEFKYRRADGGTAHNIAWSSLDQPSITVDKILYNRDGLKTMVVIDSPAVAAVDGVNCEVTLPQFDTSNVVYTPLANVTVPFTPHVKTYLYGVQGYDQNVPITEDVTVDRNMAWQFWVSYAPEDGYVALNAGQWHIDFWTFTSDFVAPTVTGYGTTGVVNFGDHHNGTWKIGSKVTLTSGDEFLTHGGTEQSGPVTRYRLVFTPNAGFVLPDTLPGDGFKVGGSAVFHVYLPADAA